MQLSFCDNIHNTGDCQCAGRTDVTQIAWRANTAVLDTWPAQKSVGKTLHLTEEILTDGKHCDRSKTCSSKEQPNPSVRWKEAEEPVYFIKYKSWFYPDPNSGHCGKLAPYVRYTYLPLVSLIMTPPPDTNLTCANPFVTQLKWCICTDTPQRPSHNEFHYFGNFSGQYDVKHDLCDDCDNCSLLWSYQNHQHGTNCVDINVAIALQIPPASSVLLLENLKDSYSPSITTHQFI